MTTSARRSVGLVQQNARLLVAFFIVFELLAAAAVAAFLMMPVARRSAGDLAGLMLLSAQTWSELPPETRPAFERELANAHMLTLRAEPPLAGRDEWRSPYVHLLETALAERSGDVQRLSREQITGEDWYWALLPSGEGMISVGFPIKRIEAQPALTLLVWVAVGLALAYLAARWLAQRIVAPLTRMERAVLHLGGGQVPELLDESGPRELAGLAARFNTMARQVRELLLARTTLLAGLSHDLRTPLARMRLALTLLEERPSARALAQLEQDVAEMDWLVGDVLDLARGLEGEPSEEFDLRPFLNELAAITSNSARIRVTHMHAKVRAAPKGLRRALANLLENALHYSADQVVDLVVQVDDGAVRIGVLDRGPGIPVEQFDAVFQPFFRLDASRSPATGGAGLGLAIVHQLAIAHGWDVKLALREGGGLEAWLTLPGVPNST